MSLRPCGCGGVHRLADRLLFILLGSAHGVVNEVSVSQQLARRDRYFLHAGNNPERANATQAPAPLGANLGWTPFLGRSAPANCQRHRVKPKPPKKCQNHLVDEFGAAW